MDTIDFNTLCSYARQFSQMDESKTETLHSIAEDIAPYLPDITANCYQHLRSIDKVQPFLQDRIEQLKQIHLDWLQDLFSAKFDSAYTEQLYRFGEVNVRRRLPIEIITGGMSITHSQLIGCLQQLYQQQPIKLLNALIAINAGMGFTLLVLQESYQTSVMTQELNKFLSITGMSRKLFDNLAKSYD